jgi:hypothetical protein
VRSEAGLEVHTIIVVKIQCGDVAIGGEVERRCLGSLNVANRYPPAMEGLHGCRRWKRAPKLSHGCGDLDAERRVGYPAF